MDLSEICRSNTQLPNFCDDVLGCVLVIQLHYTVAMERSHMDGEDDVTLDVPLRAPLAYFNHLKCLSPFKAFITRIHVNRMAR